MSIVAAAIVIGVVFVGVVVYQLVKSNKAVTVANVEATAKADATAVKSDVKKS